METTYQITYNPSEITDKRLYNELKNQIKIEVQQLEFLNWIETESDEEHRAIRLNDIINRYKTYCEIGELCSFDKLSSVLDHKGELSVSWYEEPTDLEKDVMAKIWEIYGNELSENVVHYLLTPVRL
jgi:hypothetical protein